VNKEVMVKRESVGGEMSFMEHLDELRKRLVWSVLFVGLAFTFCWFVSKPIFNFLSVPVRRALSESQRREIKVEGETGDEKVLLLSELKEGETVRYVFDKATKVGVSVLSPGTSVGAKVSKDREGNIALFTDEAMATSNAVIPKGVRLPVDLNIKDLSEPSADESLVVTTAGESFTLYVTVSLYAAIGLSVPFLLWQIWALMLRRLYFFRQFLL
jgi:sec-independent protein translocase protein TatC